LNNQEVDMNHVSLRGIKFVAVALAAVLVCGACRESAAHAVERLSQPREAAAHSHGLSSAASSDQQARLGPMRYYGGPKSPMWRGPAAN
jgi:hypothetical protein